MYGGSKDAESLMMWCSSVDFFSFRSLFQILIPVLLLSVDPDVLRTLLKLHQTQKPRTVVEPAEISIVPTWEAVSRGNVAEGMLSSAALLYSSGLEFESGWNFETELTAGILKKRSKTHKR